MNWHLISREEALEFAGSRPGGLTASEAEERLAQYGPNQLAGKKKKPAWLMFLGQFKDVMILILMGAAVVSGLVGDLKDTVVILIIVALIRELFGKGSLFAGSAVEMKIIGPSADYFINTTESTLFGWYSNNNLMVVPSAAMFVIGILIWIQRSRNKKLVDIS